MTKPILLEPGGTSLAELAKNSPPPTIDWLDSPLYPIERDFRDAEGGKHQLWLVGVKDGKLVYVEQ